ncbi:terminase [Asticcacaulis sp. AC460]|uniref:terminase large subunit domain-containing protein n=1 Tax=Asticcacaulis sp. AC460 TaxID=1282360 RepID=UPI0003C3B0FD|nr:terminase family protein [Asticcacaulis sp. AC460]ESQ89994.1 terminase [Asticcacaulis sp. AC460]
MAGMKQKPASTSDKAVKPFDPKRHARTLYWCGWSVSQIAEEIELPRTTVQSWKDRDKWDDASPLMQAETCLTTRFNLLVMKEEKTGHDFKEIDLLGREMERLARVRRYEAPGGHEGDLNPKVQNRNKGDRKKASKNLISRETVEKLDAAFREGLFGYQENWLSTTGRRIRMLLKSRQVGATWYFARERFMRALETGNNQIFISASRAQANIFRNYIVDFVYKVSGVQLTGDPMVIDRGQDADGNILEPVTLYFLGTNYRTAQGYTGDVIIDEYAWIYGFDDIFKVASAIATHKRFTITLFSTPSTIAHPSYPMWTGERFNRKRSKADRVKIDISHEALKAGVVGPDGIYRQIITLQDAIEAGFDLVDIEELRLQYSIDEFANLFGCEFVDDSKSSFPLSLVKPCMVDSWDVWDDFQPLALRPYAGETWLGYDPDASEQGDGAGVVVCAAPKNKQDKFRVLERRKFRGLDFEQQAEEIRKLTKKYHVTEIAIDCTGVGKAVFDLVAKFFVRARRIDYSVHTKSLMVHKAQNVFRNRRCEFDLGWTDLAAALMSIHPELTKGGRELTYVARRSAETGHGDIGWALLNCLYCEPLDAGEGGQKSRVRVLHDD